MKNKILAILAVLVGGLLVGGFSVSAFEAGEMGSAMTVSPSIQKIILVPGETVSGSLVVSNPNGAKSDLKYSATVGSYSLGRDENGRTDYNDTDVDTVTSYNQIMNWITLEKEEGVVAPNNKDTISFTINVPLDVPAGGQYATILIQDDTAEEGEGNLTISEKIRFAAVIMAEVAGEAKREGEVSENSVPFISFSNPLVVSSIVENKGSVHADAEYVLQVYSLFSDKEVYSNEDEPKRSLVLPESERYSTQSWDEAPSVGIFKVRQTVKIYGAESVTERIVILCPLWLLFVIIIVIVLAILWLVSRYKNRQKN